MCEDGIATLFLKIGVTFHVYMYVAGETKTMRGGHHEGDERKRGRQKRRGRGRGRGLTYGQTDCESLRAPSSTPTPKTPETQTMVWVFPPQKLRPWSEFLLFPINTESGVGLSFGPSFFWTMVWVSSHEDRNIGVGVDEWALNRGIVKYRGAHKYNSPPEKPCCNIEHVKQEEVAINQPMPWVSFEVASHRQLHSGCGLGVYAWRKFVSSCCSRADRVISQPPPPPPQ